MEIYNELIKRDFIFKSEPAEVVSFIMSDGKFLDMVSTFSEMKKEKKSICDWYKKNHRLIVTHPVLDSYCLDNNLIDKRHNKTLIQTDNAIALNDGTNFECESAYIVIPEKEPTKEQYDALLSWLYYLMNKSKTVQITKQNNMLVSFFEFASKKNVDGVLPEEIIKLIKRLYNQQNSMA